MLLNHRITLFSDPQLLTISHFNPNYAAFDLHVTRVAARIGLLAYGWDITADREIEFGTNPGSVDNYLFMHRLFLHLSSLCEGKFTPVDLDRILWHLGRCKCKAVTKCITCPISDVCLTGKKEDTLTKHFVVLQSSNSIQFTVGHYLGDSLKSNGRFYLRSCL